MDIAEAVKLKIAQKIKELEDLNKMLPSHKDKECGSIVHSDPIELLFKIEKLEEEINGLEEELKMARCKVCEGEEGLIKVRGEEGNIVYVCENCYESVCEGYEKVEEEKEGGD